VISGIFPKAKTLPLIREFCFDSADQQRLWSLIDFFFLDETKISWIDHDGCTKFESSNFSNKRNHTGLAISFVSQFHHESVIRRCKIWQWRILALEVLAFEKLDFLYLRYSLRL